MVALRQIKMTIEREKLNQDRKLEGPECLLFFGVCAFCSLQHVSLHVSLPAPGIVPWITAGSLCGSNQSQRLWTRLE